MESIIMIKRVCSTIVVLLLFAINVYADDEPGQLLNGHDPSYFMYTYEDESHLEFTISVKYPLLSKNSATRSFLRRHLKGKNDVYFSYSGAYDFFLFSDEAEGRDSAPVISRKQNPGLFVRHTTQSDTKSLKSVSIGWFHESNGQQLTERADYLTTVNASDYVSRGWDYVGVDLGFSQPFPWIDKDTHSYSVRLKLFCNCQGMGTLEKEDDVAIFGETRDLQISDFDGLRLSSRNRLDSRWNYTIGLKTGISNMDALSNLSYQLELTYRLRGIPVSLLYFNGYGKDIATYHIKDSYIGLGLKMW